jgi:hypothetical protein
MNTTPDVPSPRASRGPRLRRWLPFVLALVVLGLLLLGWGVRVAAQQKEPGKGVRGTIGAPLQRPGEATPFKTAPSAQTPASKVDALAEEIRRARNLAQVRQAYAKLGFTPAERDALARRLEKDRALTELLKRLGQPELQQRKAASAAKGKTSQRAKLGLAAHQESVQRRSAEARQAFLSPPLPRPAPRRGDFTGPMAARVFRTGPELETRGDIDGVSPTPAIVGEPVVISGDDLGTTRGEVFFLYAPERAAFPASITSWSGRRIEVAIPEAVARRVGESRKLLQLRVIPDGADTGPVHDVLVEPAPGRLEPSITRVAPVSVMPGQELALLGSNFLAESPGTVTFVIGSERIPARLAAGDWADTAVVVRLPGDVSGLVAQDARVELENHAGNTSSLTVRFEPILEEETLYQVWEHECWGLLGHKQIVTHHDFPLANQWQVVESRLQGSALGWFGPTSGIGGGCIEKREPTPGSADPGYRFEGWCNALNIVWCDTWVDVRGPRGTGHR